MAADNVLQHAQEINLETNEPLFFKNLENVQGDERDGVAGFFIDLAVCNPNKPGEFLMGIECDRATCHSAKSARDRDRLRQEVLENLGWKIRRIWSTGWFRNADAQLRPLLTELERMRTTRATMSEWLQSSGAKG